MSGANEDSPQQMVLKVNISDDDCTGTIQYGMGKPTSGVRFRTKRVGCLIAARVIARGVCTGQLTRKRAEALGSVVGRRILASGMDQGQPDVPFPQIDMLNWFPI